MIYSTRVLTCGIITKNLTVFVKQVYSESPVLRYSRVLVCLEKCKVAKPRASEAIWNPRAVATLRGLTKLGGDYLQS